ncbi:methionine aminotransferase [Orrella daihaiensis]|uniref:Aminotransferase class I/II-fold pyridoxal phosphate-dependent enzyme n=1 Tax=Orrella daihaiensis TaxID=2782176 RepID=A0ABY4AJT0_9BURK|nr:methionine aminotransferase [Orrella daihaiensis]UOD50535.1 aminotransferase class I/II-fold pyridoxal phosphate-dependent enzyme [Orrella daihaiensis]
MLLTSKLPDIGTTIFTVMSKMALDHNAINLGQGFPDFNADPRLLELVNEAMLAGHNQYPYMPGVDSLREVIRDKVSSLYKRNYNKDTEITVTSGATEAIMASVLSIVNTGDEVIVIEPNYDSYVPAIRLAGGVPVRVSMDPPSNLDDTFHVNWDRVSAAVTKKTKLIMVNFPHNPTGAVLTDSDLNELEKIIAGTDILLLSDEVYEHIIFTAQGHLSLASRPKLAERSFVISSFGKTTHTTGWKIGYCCAPEALTKELRKIHQFLVFTVPSPLQHALANYTSDSSTYLNLPEFYKTKRDRLATGLSRTRFKPYACPGTFFMLADYSAISDMPEAEFAMWLTKEHGVTVIPVSAFYASPDAIEANHGLVRFCFAKTDDTLDRAIERLMQI